MSDLGRTLILFGLLLVVIGAIFLVFNRFNIPLGHLPGDITIRKNNFSFYFPLGTSILISVVLSLLLWIIGRIRR